MASPTVPMSSSNRFTNPYDSAGLADDLEKFVETSAVRNRSGRGALTGVLLGAGLWAVILAAIGIIRL